jgi:hypothetical protein
VLLERAPFRPLLQVVLLSTPQRAVAAEAGAAPADWDSLRSYYPCACHDGWIDLAAPPQRSCEEGGSGAAPPKAAGESKRPVVESLVVAINQRMPAVLTPTATR